ncbi:MAG: DUF4842 domain-containing protein [Bacteroidaceae bacterium]|nr:DUF4842 domain-containing protein [Bacteroidaceae bacterium]
MKLHLSYICMGLVLTSVLASCIKDPYDEAAAEALRQAEEAAADSLREAEIAKNLASVFGVTFSADHDWSSTTSGTITVTADADMDNIQSVQIITGSPFGSGDGNGATILTAASVQKGQRISLTYDAPSYLTRLYAACVSSDGSYYIKGFTPGQESISFSSSSASKAQTRAIAANVMQRFESLPQAPVLSEAEFSFARERGYAGFENDLLYHMSDADEKAQIVSLIDFDYDADTKIDLRDIILSYLPNKVSNIEKIRQSQYFNASSYPLTTGEDPIIVEPIYKNDGGWQEVEGCFLYYYYFRESDIDNMTEAEQVQYFKNLPKYRALNVYNSVYYKDENGNKLGMADDSLRRNTAYALIYWGEGTPVVGETTGQYRFPKGYRIGFMLRNCDGLLKNSKSSGKDNHHGEMYCDGRLNTDVNKWKDLKSSKLGDTDPRMAWLTANGKYFLCCETGTDRDFNDLVLEVEGGVEPIGDLPALEKNVYTFCFEDRDLGDYDMNDVVIKAQRLDRTHVKYSLEACGANDQLYLRNINGHVLNDATEIHALFGVSTQEFVNVIEGETRINPIQEIIEVDEFFTFTNQRKQLYIYNKTQNRDIYISQKGQDPHAILIPVDFKYPQEQICIKDAYLKFNSWGQKAIADNNWYKSPVSGKVYTRSVFK